MKMINIQLSDIISILSLVFTIIFSIYAVYLGVGQNRLNKIAKNLTKIQLDREINESIDKISASISAKPYKYSKSIYRLRIANVGKSEAKNLVLKKLDNNDFIDDEEILGKFPHAILNAGESIDIYLNVYLSSTMKTHFAIEWEDGYSKNNRKEFHISI